MYPITSDFADRLRSINRDLIVKAEINSEIYGPAHIVDFEIENSLTLTQELEIGTAVMSKLTITLRLKGTIPANARIGLYVAAGIEEWLPLGEFYVDSRQRVNDVWTFTCFDKLVKADAPYISSLTYPASQLAVFNEICTRLGFVKDSSVVINPAYTIPVGPTGYSMREVLGYIAGANSASVYIAKNGKIKFKRFAAADVPVFAMTTSDYIRIKLTNPVKTYTRVVVTYDSEDGLEFEAGTGDEAHTLYVVNPFATQAITNALYASINGLSYLPIDMDAIGYPQLEQGDTIGFARYEGGTWEETISSWDGTDIPWNGIVQYQTIMLHTVFRYKGGLRMQIEAPSLSDQQSEFPVAGPLSDQINKLNKDAVRESRNYFGVTVNRQDGLLVARDDGKSQLTLNSDVMDWRVNGVSQLYYDAIANKIKFTGELQAASGTFSGNLSAAGGTFTGTLVGVNGSFSGTISASTIIGGTISGGTISGGSINGTTITGGTITGSTVQTAGSSQRVVLGPSGLISFDTNGVKRISIETFDSWGYQELRFHGESGSQVGTVSGTNGQINVTGTPDADMVIGAKKIAFASRVDFQSVTVVGFPISNVSGLQGEINAMKGDISSAQTALNNKAAKSVQTGASSVYNAGIPIGTKLLIEGGGTVTWNGVPAHTHTQL